jgi:hypothetical protein
MTCGSQYWILLESIFIMVSNSLVRFSFRKCFSAERNLHANGSRHGIAKKKSASPASNKSHVFKILKMKTL